jgi:VIT1/CCC1 family predicted Fe2+/Mn2+ transporter
VLLFARLTGLVAGTLAIGTVEYSKLRAEHDRQAAQLAAERAQLETAPDAELDELTGLYVSRGLSPDLAKARRDTADGPRCAGSPRRDGVRHYGSLSHRSAP